MWKRDQFFPQHLSVQESAPFRACIKCNVLIYCNSQNTQQRICNACKQKKGHAWHWVACWVKAINDEIDPLVVLPKELMLKIHNYVVYNPNVDDPLTFDSFSVKDLIRVKGQRFVPHSKTLEIEHVHTNFYYVDMTIQSNTDLTSGIRFHWPHREE